VTPERLGKTFPGSPGLSTRSRRLFRGFDVLAQRFPSLPEGWSERFGEVERGLRTVYGEGCRDVPGVNDILCRHGDGGTSPHRIVPFHTRIPLSAIPGRRAGGVAPAETPRSPWLRVGYRSGPGARLYTFAHRCRGAERGLSLCPTGSYRFGIAPSWLPLIQPAPSQGEDRRPSSSGRR